MRLNRIDITEASSLNNALSFEDILPQVQEILNAVRIRKDRALREYAELFGDLKTDAPMVFSRQQLDEAVDKVDAATRGVLERTAERIRRFAEAQRASLNDLTVPIEGGTAGHTVLPLERAACYAPGGRYPLPSSVLMTAVTARVAGVGTVWVASPKPSIETVAAAGIAGADALLAVGGAQAVAALAYGTETIPKFDVIVGPGNRWVTAAKQIVAGETKIDMLAGPSELAIVADETADPRLVAADLLAQAEHDPDARVFLIAPSTSIMEAVERELSKQLEKLITRRIAELSLKKSFAILVNDVDRIAQLLNVIAPEHVSLQADEGLIERLRPLLKNYGGLFIGPNSAEVFGDYGMGPNHVLPTQGSARTRGGLSVFDFLKIQTWVKMDRVPFEATEDIQKLARMEGLEAHRRSAALRSLQGKAALSAR